MKEATIPQQTAARGRKPRSWFRVVHVLNKSRVSSSEDSEVAEAFLTNASSVLVMKMIVKGMIPTVIRAAVEKSAVRLKGVCLNRELPGRAHQAR